MDHSFRRWVLSLIYAEMKSTISTKLEIVGLSKIDDV